MRSSRQLSPSLTWPRLASPRLTLLADRPVLARRLLTRRISATASSVSAMLPRSRACACTRSPIGVRACARAHVCGSICHATSDVVSLQDFQHWKQAKTFAAQPSSVADGGAALKSFEVHTTSPAPTAVPKPSCDLSWSRLPVSHHALFSVQADVVLHGLVRSNRRRRPIIAFIPHRRQATRGSFCHTPFVLDVSSKQSLLKVTPHSIMPAGVAHVCTPIILIS